MKIIFKQDELLRMQSKEGSTGDCQISSSGWNTKRSMNILRQSLSYPIILPVIDDDDDEEMEIDDEEMEIDDKDVENTPIQAALPSHDESNDDAGKSASLSSQAIFSEPTDFCRNPSVNGDSKTEHLIGLEKNAIFEAENMSKDHLIPDIIEGKHIDVTDRKSHENLVADFESTKVNDGKNNLSHSDDKFLADNISPSVSLCSDICNEILQDSYQPVEDQCSSRKSQKTILSMSASSKVNAKDDHSCSWLLNNSYTHMSKSCPSNAAFTEVSNHFSTPANRSGSLHHGQTSPCETFPTEPSIPVIKVDLCMQTLPEESEVSTSYVCTFCKKAQTTHVYKDVGVNTEPDLTILDESHSNQKTTKKIPRVR